MNKCFHISSILLPILLFGCGSDNGPSTSNSFVINGKITADSGYSVPINGEIALVWQISTSSPDYTFISAGELVSETEFSLNLPSSLEQDAINSHGVAVGIVTLFSSGAAPASGIVLSLIHI